MTAVRERLAPDPPPGGGDPVDWSKEQWHDYFFGVLAQKGLTCCVTPEALHATRPDLNAKGADWQRDGAGNLRPRIYLPTGDPGNPWSKAVDVGDWYGPWRWIPRY